MPLWRRQCLRSAQSFPAAAKVVSNVAFLEHDNFERYGNYTRLHYEDQSFTSFDELLYAGRIARTLTDRGIRPGERVLTVMPNTPELTATFQAVWTIGAVMVPVNPLWSAPELTYALNNCGAAAILTVPLLALRVREAAAAGNLSPRLLCFGETSVAGFDNIAPDIATAPAECTPVDCAPSDIAMLLYTSGTTARPKAVIVTHGNIPAALEAVHRVNPELPRHPILHVLPMNHIFGVLIVQLANRWGFPSVLMRQFDPVAIFQAIEQQQIGYIIMVPTMLMYLLHHPERAKYDFSSLYRIITGGASLPEPLRLSFQQAFRCRVDQGYGMSETGFQLLLRRPGTLPPGLFGQAVPGLRSSYHRRSGARFAAADGGRNLRTGRQRHARLLEGSGEYQPVHSRAMVPHRRCRLSGPRWLFVHHRPQEGSDHQGRREHFAARD